MGVSVIRSLYRFAREEGGAVAIQIALTTTVLLGFAGLVVDLGEAFTLNTELQQAADAAALAAAAELDGFTDAQKRATAAACGTGTTCTFGPNFQRFATSGSGNIKLTSVVFLSSIDAAEPTLLPPVVAPAGDVKATGDSDSFYVRIQAQTSSVTGTLASFVSTNSIFTTTASATAGRIPIACLDTPLAICNPLPGKDPFGAGGLKVGQEVQVTNIGSGDWGGICPPNSGNCPKPTFESYTGTASSSSPAVASCVNSLTPYTSSPGNPNNPQFDTRFGVSSKASEPPSININEYPPDSAFTTTTLASGGTTVVGNGTWDATSAAGYNWSSKHPGITYPPATMGKNGPTGNPTRYDVYNWENTTGTAPNYSIPGGAQTSPGTPSADRRLMNMAIMDCSLSGRKQFGADGYLVGFLLRKWQTSLTDAFDTAHQQQFFFEIQSALTFSNTSGLIHNHVQLVR